MQCYFALLTMQDATLERQQSERCENIFHLSLFKQLQHCAAGIEFKTLKEKILKKEELFYSHRSWHCYLLFPVFGCVYDTELDNTRKNKQKGNRKEILSTDNVKGFNQPFFSRFTCI